MLNILETERAKNIYLACYDKAIRSSVDEEESDYLGDSQVWFTQKWSGDTKKTMNKKIFPQFTPKRLRRDT